LILSSKENKPDTTVTKDETTGNGDESTDVREDETSAVDENDKEKIKEQQNGGKFWSQGLNA
jgi:hypothetical protein